MSTQTWQELFIAANAAGPTISATTATSILPPNAKATIPGGYLSLGREIELTVLGQMSNIVTTPGTILFGIYLGGTAVFTSDAYQICTTASTNLPFLFRVLLTLAVEGTSAQFLGQGWAAGRIFPTGGSGTSAAFVRTYGMVPMPQATPALGTAFDATIDNVLDVRSTFSLSGNAFTVQQYFARSLN